MSGQPVVVIGGGLTGLVAAEQLQQQGRQVLVLEREQESGGCCRSIDREGYIFDYTGHLLHVAQQTTRDYLERLGLWEQLVVHTRQAGIWVGGHLTPYPIQINTHGLSPEVRRDCLLGFIRAWARQGRDDDSTAVGPAQESRAACTEPRGDSRRRPARTAVAVCRGGTGTRSRARGEESFHDWVLERFGDGLARHFFFPYNSKLLRAEPHELSLDWIDRYVPRPRLEEVIDGALGLYHAPVGYNATFRYPAAGGIRLLPDCIAKRVGQLRLGSEVTALHAGERWLELANGERVAYQHLLATLPLPRLIDLLVDALPKEIREARQRLRWVAVLNLALGVQGPAPRSEHWIYFPDPELPFYRVGFPSNHGQVAPAGHHTVSIELSLTPGSGEIEVQAAAAEEALSRLGLLDREQVRVRQLTVVDPAYVVYDHHRRRALQAIRDFLDGNAVVLAGRWAEWKYSAMEDAVLDGLEAAESLA